MKAACQVTTPAVRALREETERLADAAEDVDLSGISDSLRKLLGAGEAEGDPFSASFGGPDSDIFGKGQNPFEGKTIGGAFSNKYAFQLIEAIAELVRRKGEKGQDPTKYQQNLQDAKKYFTYIFGTKFGDIGRLIEEFNALLKKQQAAQQQSRTTPVTTSQPTTTAVNLIILQKLGGLP